MSDTDPAFQWEAEALRNSPKPVVPAQPEPPASAAETPSPAEAPAADLAGWQTLREAHQSTGIPIETLRKWARRGTIGSVLEETELGTRRLVDPEAVSVRAAQLGRAVAPIAESEADGAAENGSAADPREEAEAPTPNGTQQNIVDAHPAGTMIVPIDAWDKMLAQLGNLHEAGQQLAEARERAAKAETEAKFLKERLSELRATESAASPPIDPQPIAVETAPAATKPAVPEGSSEPIGLQEYAKRRWQAWRRR